MTEQLYSAEEAAQILGLQVRTVRNYVREGRLPGVRIGKQYRIARADLEAFTTGGLSREEVLEGLGQQSAPAAVGPPDTAEVSSVVQIDGIAPDARDRLERTLTAATLASAADRPLLRVEPLYDEDRRRLKLIIVGPLGEVVDVLRILDAFTREPGSLGAF
jgi:excisionase family DNA binding protein